MVKPPFQHGALKQRRISFIEMPKHLPPGFNPTPNHQSQRCQNLSYFTNLKSSAILFHSSPKYPKYHLWDTKCLPWRFPICLMNMAEISHGTSHQPAINHRLRLRSADEGPTKGSPHRWPCAWCWRLGPMGRASPASPRWESHGVFWSKTHETITRWGPRSIAELVCIVNNYGFMVRK